MADPANLHLEPLPPKAQAAPKAALIEISELRSKLAVALPEHGN